jgi:ADP-ribosyl-[dinitrogen reductase] hydrolase
LGDDADTTAAICGQLAGAYYGESGIPAEWLEELCMRDTITAFADGLLAASGSQGHV